MNTLRLSVLMLRRDWRAGEWRVLLIALVLAVGSIATVGLFADRIRLALQQEATSLLGADLRLTSTRPLPPTYRAAALQRGLHVVETATFLSMVTTAQQNLLAEIQAVEEGYPLRGKIVITPDCSLESNQLLPPCRVKVGMGLEQRDSSASTPSLALPLQGGGDSSIPARGTIWADTRLMQRMGLHLGDEVGIGALRLRLAAHVVRDVDQSVGFFSFAPRVLLNAGDLPSSGLVQEGSRISYRLLAAGDAVQVAGLRAWLQGRLGLSEKLEDVRDARPEIRSSLERAEHYLGLAALTAVVLAGVALALAARHFITRHLDACAMMRCMGAAQAQVLRIFLYQFLLLGACAALLGCLLGYASQALLVQSIPAMRESALPPPGWIPLWQAAASGMALLLGFAFLPLWQLKSVSPLRVIRRELGVPEMHTGMMYASGAAVLCGLFLWQAGSLKLGLTVLLGLFSGALLFGLLAWLAVRALTVLPLPARRYALVNLARHGRSNAVQIVALSLGGMALLLLTFVRADLLENWRTRLPPDAPNRFIVNIQPDQRAPLQDFFARQKLPVPKLFPMVRGRLIAINQHTVSGDDYADPHLRELVEREFNLSWSDSLPAGNELVQGAWMEQGASSVLSVEEGIAKNLGIHVGDTLTYEVAGTRFSAQVVNLRKVQWDSMRVNFFVLAAPGMLENYPASYVTSYHLLPDKTAAGDALLKTFPGLLLIDTEAMIAQVRHIMDQIAQAMSAVFLFTLLSGLAVLYAALLATQDERTHQAAILRTLGADSHYLRRLHLTEFAVLGALSGLFAAAGAAVLGWVLAHRVLQIPYHPGIVLWLAGLGGGTVIVTLAGWLVTRRVAQVPPLRLEFLR
ncbi:MAG: FtsX-like permease family protein [Nitrosomonadales bacterium]|nr:FtsX-like permease family protein [Nitrosomonadales bacterium]